MERAAETSRETSTRRTRHAVAAAKPCLGAWNLGVHAQRPTDSNRRPAEQSALPVHAAKSGYAEPVSVSTGFRGKDAGTATAGGREHRSANPQSSSQCADSSR